MRFTVECVKGFASGLPCRWMHRSRASLMASKPLLSLFGYRPFSDGDTIGRTSDASLASKLISVNCTVVRRPFALA